MENSERGGNTRPPDLPLEKFPYFVEIQTVKGFGVVSKAEVDVFLELSCFFYDPTNVGSWSLVPLLFLNLR